LSRWRRISSSARRSNRAARRSARGNVQIRNARTGRPLAGGHAVTLVGSHIGKGKAEDLADEITGEGPSVPPRRSRATSCSSPYAQAHAGRQHGDALDRRVVVDVTKLVDISVLEPLDTTPFGSGAEVVADVAPDGARVVKAFNTVFAGTLLAGAVDGRPLDVFLARDDEAAKATVAALAREGGAAPPIDAGRFARARELDLEALGYLHMAVQPSFSDATVATVSSVGRAHPTATTFDEATYASTTPLRVRHTGAGAAAVEQYRRRGAGHRCRDDRPLRTTEPGSLVWSCGARGAAAPRRSTPAPRLAPLYVGGCSTSIAPIPIRAIGRETQVRGAPR